MKLLRWNAAVACLIRPNHLHSSPPTLPRRAGILLRIAPLIVVWVIIGLVNVSQGPAQPPYSQDRPAPASQPKIEMPKVRVAEDGSRFILAGSGETFIPWGFNYLGRFGELVEETWANDWDRLAADFRQMRKLGANVVRVHLQFSTFMKGPNEVDRAELGRLRNMLDLARETCLYLDITGLSLYRLDRIPAWYDQMDEDERWQAQAVFWEAIAQACAGHPAVFCYDLMNEPIVSGPAKEGEPRWVTGELGGFWFVQRITDTPGNRSQADIAQAWVAKLTAAIRQHDPQTLITVGVIPWAHVWPNAKPIFYSPQALQHLDFVSIHLYPNRGEVEKAIQAAAVYDLGKPLVIEETFPLSCSIEELDAFIEGTRGRVDGWISHYFGHTIAEHRAGAEPAGPLVAAFLEYWRDKGRSITSVTPGEPKPQR
ncbi:MAG TPA: cellulase family glycosylhydrolase [Phycisphaeraceae bacterium]